jgi:hypothetical protein
METWLASERNPKNTPPPLEYQFTGELGERNKITVKSWEAANNLCLYLEGVGIWGNGYDRVVQKASQYPLVKPSQRHSEGLEWGRYNVQQGFDVITKINQ